MALTWYESDGTTPVTATQAFGSVAAGAESTAWEPWIYWNDGTPGGQATNIKLLVQALDGASWVSSGLPVLDQHEIEVRIQGYDSTGDSTWVPAVTALRQRIGAEIPFEIGTIPGDCGVQLEIVFAPRLQSATSAADVTVQFPVVYNEILQSIVPGINEVGGYGVLTGVGDPYVSEWVTASLATETGTPDDYVQISASWFVGAGTTYRVAAGQHQLSQNDVTPAALTSGEAYYALVSQPIDGGAQVVTKGAKDTAGSQAVPTLPADSLAIALVAVNYDAGGTVIETADIEQIAADGRLLVSDAGGLDVTIAAGRAITRRGLVTRTLATTETLPDDETTTLYLASDGTISQTAGDFPLATVTTASGDITKIVDARRYIEPVYTQNEAWTTLTESSATSIATVAYPASSTATVDLRVRIEASDGTEYQTVVGAVRVASARKATGNTVSAIALVGSDVQGCSSGTLSWTATVTEGAEYVTVKANALSSLTQTTLRANVEVISKSPGCIVQVL